MKWALHAVVGDAFDLERVSLYDGAQLAFLALNPNHKVPVLEITWKDGGLQRMLESAAIVEFLADAYPDQGLAPPSGASATRADYLQMLHFGGNWIDMMLWQVRIHEDVLPESASDARTVARYRHEFSSEVQPQRAARLTAGPLICGERFSAAACVVAHDVTWARGYGLCQGDLFRQYISRVSKRPAFVAAFADAREFQRQPAANNPMMARFSG